MSTILNTLKKLEEEKSVLEKNVNLKGLLLQGQESVYPQSEKQTPRKGGALWGMVILGVLIAWLAVSYFFSSEPKAERVETVNLPDQAAAVSVVNPAPKKVAANPGIPLSGIPETEPVQEDDLLRDDDFFGPEDELPLEMEPSPPAIKEQPEPEGSAEIREIKNLIQAATQPEEVASQSLLGQGAALGKVRHIPGLKLKGIIFFNSNNPANHIFIATPTENNRKLKVGDAVLGATLESVEAQKAIFSYQGQWAEMVMGE